MNRINITMSADVWSQVDVWSQMLVEAANSCINGRERKNICRTIYPNGNCFLELKTDKEIKDAFQKHGSGVFSGFNCGRMHLREVLNITRIFHLNNPVFLQDSKEKIKKSLLTFSSRAEKKYNDGFKGIIRKIISVFFNLFVTDSVSLFAMRETNVSLRVFNNINKGKLPWFIGSDVDFVRLIDTTTLGN